MRLAVVVSHPIQYYVPWYRARARVSDLEVFFCHRQDAADQAAAGFGVEFEWDLPLLDGYRTIATVLKVKRSQVDWPATSCSPASPR